MRGVLNARDLLEKGSRTYNTAQSSHKNSGSGNKKHSRTDIAVPSDISHIQLADNVIHNTLLYTLLLIFCQVLHF